MWDTLEYLLYKLKPMLVRQLFLVYTELFLENLSKKKNIQASMYKESRLWFR